MDDELEEGEIASPPSENQKSTDLFETISDEEVVIESVRPKRNRRRRCHRTRVDFDRARKRLLHRLRLKKQGQGKEGECKELPASDIAEVEMQDVGPDMEDEAEIQQLRLFALQSQRSPSKPSGSGDDNKESAGAENEENEYLLRAEALKTALLKKRPALLQKMDGAKNQKNVDAGSPTKKTDLVPKPELAPNMESDNPSFSGGRKRRRTRLKQRRASAQRKLSESIFSESEVGIETNFVSPIRLGSRSEGTSPVNGGIILDEHVISLLSTDDELSPTKEYKRSRLRCLSGDRENVSKNLAAESAFDFNKPSALEQKKVRHKKKRMEKGNVTKSNKNIPKNGTAGVRLDEISLLSSDEDKISKVELKKGNVSKIMDQSLSILNRVRKKNQLALSSPTKEPSALTLPINSTNENKFDFNKVTEFRIDEPIKTLESTIVKYLDGIAASVTPKSHNKSSSGLCSGERTSFTSTSKSEEKTTSLASSAKSSGESKSSTGKSADKSTSLTSSDKSSGESTSSTGKSADKSTSLSSSAKSSEESTSSTGTSADKSTSLNYSSKSSEECTSSAAKSADTSKNLTSSDKSPDDSTGKSPDKSTSLMSSAAIMPNVSESIKQGSIKGLFNSETTNSVAVNVIHVNNTTDLINRTVVSANEVQKTTMVANLAATMVSSLTALKSASNLRQSTPSPPLPRTIASTVSNTTSLPSLLKPTASSLSKPTPSVPLTKATASSAIKSTSSSALFKTISANARNFTPSPPLLKPTASGVSKPTPSAPLTKTTASTASKPSSSSLFKTVTANTRNSTPSPPLLKTAASSMGKSVLNNRTITMTKNKGQPMDRIVIRLGDDSSDDDFHDSKNGTGPLVKSLDSFLQQARKRSDVVVTPSTPEAVYQHLAPKQRLEYVQLKQKLVEKEKQIMLQKAKKLSKKTATIAQKIKVQTTTESKTPGKKRKSGEFDFKSNDKIPSKITKTKDSNQPIQSEVDTDNNDVKLENYSSLHPTHSRDKPVNTDSLVTIANSEISPFSLVTTEHVKTAKEDVKLGNIGNSGLTTDKISLESSTTVVDEKLPESDKFVEICSKRLTEENNVLLCLTHIINKVVDSHCASIEGRKVEGLGGDNGHTVMDSSLNLKAEFNSSTATNEKNTPEIISAVTNCGIATDVSKLVECSSSNLNIELHIPIKSNVSSVNEMKREILSECLSAAETNTSDDVLLNVEDVQPISTSTLEAETTNVNLAVIVERNTNDTKKTDIKCTDDLLPETSDNNEDISECGQTEECSATMILQKSANKPKSAQDTEKSKETNSEMDIVLLTAKDKLVQKSNASCTASKSTLASQQGPKVVKDHTATNELMQGFKKTCASTCSAKTSADGTLTNDVKDIQSHKLKNTSHSSLPPTISYRNMNVTNHNGIAETKNQSAFAKPATNLVPIKTPTGIPANIASVSTTKSTSDLSVKTFGPVVDKVPSTKSTTDLPKKIPSPMAANVLTANPSTATVPSIKSTTYLSTKSPSPMAANLPTANPSTFITPHTSKSTTYSSMKMQSSLVVADKQNQPSTVVSTFPSLKNPSSIAMNQLSEKNEGVRETEFADLDFTDKLALELEIQQETALYEATSSQIEKVNRILLGLKEKQKSHLEKIESLKKLTKEDASFSVPENATPPAKQMTSIKPCVPAPAAAALLNYASPLNPEGQKASLNPLQEVCSYDLHGICRDPDCRFQHLKVVKR